MRRKNSDEHVERLRQDRIVHEMKWVRRRLFRFASDNLEAMREQDPELPGDLDDRARDNWRPLLAIADVAGGTWPDRARRAAKRLRDRGPDREAGGILLLRDLRKLFERTSAKTMLTDEILAELNKMEDRPWPEWNGKALSAVQLAKLLSPFAIRPHQSRQGDEVRRGYRAQDFDDAWARYLPKPATPATG